MRLAFAVDGGRGYAGVVLRQPRADAVVSVELHLREGADPERVLGQAARILSLDHDGEAFAAVGERDRVLGALQAAHPGQRPVLFHSPYEAAAWSIISARRPAAQAAGVRLAMSSEFGATFELAGQTLHAFPQPDRLLELRPDFTGLAREKVVRLHGVAKAAREGELEPEHLHALGPERAYEEVQRLKGLGPFYAGLVVLRGTGFADAPLMSPEPRVLAHVARFYRLDPPPTLERFNEIADGWRPFRTWATVLVRLAGDRATALPER